MPLKTAAKLSRTFFVDIARESQSLDPPPFSNDPQQSRVLVEGDFRCDLQPTAEVGDTVHRIAKACDLSQRAGEARRLKRRNRISVPPKKTGRMIRNEESYPKPKALNRVVVQKSNREVTRACQGYNRDNLFGSERHASILEWDNVVSMYTLLPPQ